MDLRNIFRLGKTGYKNILREAVQRAEELAIQYGYEEIGIAVGLEMLRFIRSDLDVCGYLTSNYNEVMGVSQIKLCGFDLYPVHDEGHMGTAAIPIILSERYDPDIRYKGGELIVRGGKVYRVSDISDPLGFGLIKTDFHLDAQRRRIVMGLNPEKSWADLLYGKPSSDEFEPTPELDQLLANMTQQSG